jgi:hypothetical protein
MNKKHLDISEYLIGFLHSFNRIIENEQKIIFIIYILQEMGKYPIHFNFFFNDFSKKVDSYDCQGILEWLKKLNSFKVKNNKLVLIDEIKKNIDYPYKPLARQLMAYNLPTLTLLSARIYFKKEKNVDNKLGILYNYYYKHQDDVLTLYKKYFYYDQN